ncbi:hypothetical protein VTI74DRAFT_896 [Chaetomium olivicolor]
MRIQDFEPIGPKPPVDDPLADNFEWGVGEEADFIALTPCAYMPSLEHWVWRKWQQGLKAGTKTPGWMCQPAMGRASRTLLLALHHAQAVQGLAMHSEATLSSFALWHGLKLVVPPQPIYQDPQWPRDKMNELFNGPGAVEAHRRQGMVGMARGDAIYRQKTTSTLPPPRRRSGTRPTFRTRSMTPGWAVVPRAETAAARCPMCSGRAWKGRCMRRI